MISIIIFLLFIGIVYFVNNILNMFTVDSKNKFTAKNYGDKVKYSVTTNGVTLDDWKIFYNDKTNNLVWIIYGSCIPNKAIDTNKTGLCIGGKYRAYWDKDNVENLPYNEYALQKLTNSDNWSQLLTEQLYESGAKAYGAVNLDTYVNSWNEKGYKKLYTKTEGTTTYISSRFFFRKDNFIKVFKNVGYNDQLYYPYKEYIIDEDIDFAKGEVRDYWFANMGESNSALKVLRFGEGGRIKDDGVSNKYYAVRPVISLPTDMLTKNYDKDFWELNSAKMLIK